jgi:hypothetical protein
VKAKRGKWWGERAKRVGDQGSDTQGAQGEEGRGAYGGGAHCDMGATSRRQRTWLDARNTGAAPRKKSPGPKEGTQKRGAAVVPMGNRPDNPPYPATSRVDALEYKRHPVLPGAATSRVPSGPPVAGACLVLFGCCATRSCGVVHSPLGQNCLVVSRLDLKLRWTARELLMRCLRPRWRSTLN